MLEPALLIRIALLGALAAALGVEFFSGPAPTAPPLPAPAARTGAAPAAAPAARTAQVEKDVSTVLARPLFRVDRRPPRVAADGPAAAHGPEALPRLSGIVVSASGGTAIFEGGSKPVVARVGDRLGAFTVAAINAGSVTLDGPQGAQVMVPRFDTATTRADAAPIASPVQPLVNAASARVPLPLPPNINELINRRRAMHGQPAQ
jgi:hypothetical protein